MDRTDEIGRLGSNFNFMAESLQQSFDEVKESRERLSLAMEGANDGLWDWNIHKNELFYSPRWKSMLGLEEESDVHSLSDWHQLVHDEDRPSLEMAIANHLASLTPLLECEHRMLHADGSYRWMLCRGKAVQNGDGEPVRMSGSLTDITERKTIEHQLQYNATHDVLTGLPNRLLFMDRLERALQRSNRYAEQQFAVLFMDLDHFKLCNDSLGHTVGDELLVKVAQRLMDHVRVSDTVARLGGDEFVILIEGVTDVNDVVHFADRLRNEMNYRFKLGEDQEFFTTASIGVAMSESGYTLAEDLLRDADAAMYRAKSMGRDCYEIFDESMHTLAIQNLKLEVDLRRALENEEFEVYYQPVMRLEDDKLTGFEALVRWQHPERGLVPPMEFIPAAEENGLIMPLGMFVLREACQQIHEWQQQFSVEPPLTVSVNLSGKQILQSNLVEQIDQVLEEVGLEPTSLELEITESAIIENPELAAKVLTELKERGINFYLDDFGTGYSSLNYLHRLPFHSIKIDRSFVQKINGNEKSNQIVEAIIRLATNLGMGVVAEGVETSDQLRKVRLMKCNYVQGYYFSKPLPAGEAADYITTNLSLELT